MKKLYFVLASAIALTILLPLKGNAQNGVCPTPNPPLVQHIRYNNNLCVVYVDHMWPNAPVTLFDVNLQPIVITTTDVTGYAAMVYPCDKTPYRVSSCVNNPPNVGCCSSLVPAAAQLPVKLTNFSVQLNNDNSVLLKWNSEFEINSFKYVVEKSTDGYNFSEVGTQKAAGNSSRAIAYFYNDKSFSTGAEFYRLRQVDADGRYEFSKVIYINRKQTSGIITRIFPNPFTTDVQLVGITTSELTRNNVRIYNTMGQEVNYRITGANAIALDVNAPRGLYILKVKDQQFRLVKQ
jgi:hypothetical protein